MSNRKATTDTDFEIFTGDEAAPGEAVVAAGVPPFGGSAIAGQVAADGPIAPTGAAATAPVITPWFALLKYALVGVVFGIAFVKTEVISWFRIQEMFRLESFHMYGVIGTAVLVGMLSVAVIKRFRIKTFSGQPISFQKKTFSKGQVFGGILFGFGWAMTGACPGPLFAQVGTGSLVVLVTIASALAGTWVYGYLRDRLPH